MIDDELDLLLAQPEVRSEWRWATVTQAAPLRVRLDGEPDALPVTPDTLVAGLAVGQRVWVQIEGARLVVHGGGNTSRLRAGLVAGTTDANGYLTVTHGLGATPLMVVATPGGNAVSGPTFPQAMVTDALGPTTFRVRVLGNVNSVGMTAYTSLPVTGLWTALVQ